MVVIFWSYIGNYDIWLVIIVVICDIYFYIEVVNVVYCSMNLVGESIVVIIDVVVIWFFVVGSYVYVRVVIVVYIIDCSS